MRITIRKPDDWHLHVRDGAMLKAVPAVHGEAFRPRHPDAEPRPAGRHHGGRHRVSRARACGAAAGLDLHAADDLLPARRHRSGRRRARLSRRRVHRREALSRQRHHQFGRRRDRPQEDLPRAGAHGKDRHAVPHAWRGCRPRHRHFRSREGVHRAQADPADQDVSRPAHDPGAPLLQGRRRLRAQRQAAARRHHHALSPHPDAHRLARRRASSPTCT